MLGMTSQKNVYIWATLKLPLRTPLNPLSDKMVIQIESQKQHLSVSAFDNDNQRHDNHDDNIDVDGNA